LTRTTVFLLLLLIAWPVAAREAKKPEPEKSPIQKAFVGKVERFKARRVTLSYDLTKKESLSDFDEVNPFLAEAKGGWKCDGKALVGIGTGAIMHKAVFEADVAVNLTVISRTPRDLGVTLLQPGLTDQFLLFSVADTFFCLKDRQSPKQHMITVVGAKDSGRKRGESLFRYLNRTKKPAMKADKAFEIEVLKRGKRNRFHFNGRTMDAEDRYGEFPEIQPALFVLNSEVRVTKLTIMGKLTEGWLKEHEIPWDPKEKDDQKLPSVKQRKGDMAPAPQAGGRGSDRGRRGEGGGGVDTGGTSDAAGLIRKLMETSLAEKDRQKAAAGLTKDNVRKDEFRSLIDCLYKDDLTTRTLAIQVLKRITGKTLGYGAKAPEKSREKAIRSWWKYLRDNRERFR
jgi:hypothetical protein